MACTSSNLQDDRHTCIGFKLWYALTEFKTSKMLGISYIQHNNNNNNNNIIGLYYYYSLLHQKGRTVHTHSIKYNTIT